MSTTAHFIKADHDLEASHWAECFAHRKAHNLSHTQDEIEAEVNDCLDCPAFANCPMVPDHSGSHRDS